MGRSRTFGDLVVKFEKSNKVIVEGNAKKVEAGAKLIANVVNRRATPPTGGDLRFSGTKNKKVGVRTQVLSGGQNARAVAKATGPMHWLEGGVEPHAIVPKGIGGSRAQRVAFVANAFGTGRTSLQFGRGRGVLKFAGAGRGAGFAKYARKAGRFPKLEVWSKGVDEAAPLYVKGTSTGVIRDLTSVWD